MYRAVYSTYYACCFRPVEVPVYEMVDMSSSHPHANKPENHNMPNKPENVDIDLRILKQEQAKDFSHLPYEYLTSTFTKFDQRAGPGQVVATDKDNTYQPLIPPRFRALGDDKSEYQSLTLKTNTLPAKFNVSPMGSAPPAIPPKPKAM